MTRVISVDGVDIASALNLSEVRPTSAAFRGEQGAGQMQVDDPDFDDAYATLKVVRITDSASGSTKHLFRGRVISKNYGRGPYAADDSRVIALNVQDSNWDLRRLRVHQWARPAETGRARVIALLAYILNGSSSTVTNATKRPSTVIASTYVPNTNTVTMEARTYDATDPVAVLDDCARAEGKDYFVYVKDDGTMHLFYDRPTSTALACTLSITDDDPDLVTEFAPIVDGMAGDEDGTELLSGGALIPAGGNAAIVTESRAGIISAHDVSEETVYDSGAGTDAATRLDAFLDERENEELRYRVAIDIPAAQAHLVRAGQTISLRSAACGVLSPLTVRISRLELEILVPGDEYRLHMELAFPEKLTPRIRSNGQGSISVKQITSGRALTTVSSSLVATTTYERVDVDGVVDTVWGSVANAQGRSGTDFSTYKNSGCRASPPDGLWVGEEIYFVAIQSNAPLPSNAGYYGLQLDCDLVGDTHSEGKHGGISGAVSRTKGPHLVTVAFGFATPSNAALSASAMVGVVAQDTTSAKPITISIPSPGWGQYVTVFFQPLFRLLMGSICESEYTLGTDAAGDGSMCPGNAVFRSQTATGPGFLTAGIEGTRDGLNTAFTLPGGYDVIDEVWHNGVSIPLTAIDTSAGSPDIETVGWAPLATDTVLIHYSLP